MSSSYMDLFLLLILLIKSRATHINEQTKPPVELLRCWRPVHININKIFPECLKSTASRPRLMWEWVLRARQDLLAEI